MSLNKSTIDFNEIFISNNMNYDFSNLIFDVTNLQLDQFVMNDSQKEYVSNKIFDLEESGNVRLEYSPFVLFPKLTNLEFKNKYAEMADFQIELLKATNDPRNLVESIKTFKETIFQLEDDNKFINTIINYTLSFGKNIDKIENSIKYGKFDNDELVYDYFNKLKNHIAIILNHASEIGFFSNDSQGFCVNHYLKILTEHNCEIKSKVLIQQSFSFFNQKKYELAFDLLKRDLEIYPYFNNIEERLYLGINIANAIFEFGNHTRAQQIVNKILDLYPSCPNLILNNKLVKKINSYSSIGNESESNIIFSEKDPHLSEALQYVKKMILKNEKKVSLLDEANTLVNEYLINFYPNKILNFFNVNDHNKNFFFTKKIELNLIKKENFLEKIRELKQNENYLLNKKNISSNEINIMNSFMDSICDNSQNHLEYSEYQIEDREIADHSLNFNVLQKSFSTSPINEMMPSYLSKKNLPQLNLDLVSLQKEIQELISKNRSLESDIQNSKINLQENFVMLESAWGENNTDMLLQLIQSQEEHEKSLTNKISLNNFKINELKNMIRK
jgi:hypothetical protein